MLGAYTFTVVISSSWINPLIFMESPLSLVCAWVTSVVPDSLFLCPRDSPGNNTEWIAMLSSKESSRPRDWTCISYVSCIGRQVLYHLGNSSLVTVFILKSVLPDKNTATPAFFWFSFAWNIFLHTLTFSLYVSLGLRWFFYRQHVYGSCFGIHSASLYLLVEAFNAFTSSWWTRSISSSPQIHQKYSYKWNNSHRAPLEHWQKTSNSWKGQERSPCNWVGWKGEKEEVGWELWPWKGAEKRKGSCTLGSPLTCREIWTESEIYRLREGHSNWFVADRIARDLHQHLCQHLAHCSLRYMLLGCWGLGAKTWGLEDSPGERSAAGCVEMPEGTGVCHGCNWDSVEKETQATIG